MDSAATTRRLAALLDAASLAANGLQTTPEAVVSRENGRQLSTSSSDRSRQRNTSLASRIIHHELSDYYFLVDTGAFRSILPPSSTSQHRFIHICSPVQLPWSKPGSVLSAYQNTSHPIMDQYSHPTSGHR